MKVRSPSTSRPWNWLVIAWFSVVHAVSLGTLVWCGVFGGAVTATMGMAVGMFFMCHISITAGMHRLYAHQSYAASLALELFLLVFAAATFQGPVLWWSPLHRRHHADSDGLEDPYSVVHGFWWAHIGWMLRAPLQPKRTELRGLYTNGLVRWQQKQYWYIAAAAGFGLPTLLGSLWGDPIGGFLLGGFVRLCVQFHLTWIINSVAHTWGTRRYVSVGTARTNWWLAIPTVGESFHERHHLAEKDYRLGTKWYDPDIGKWFIWLCMCLRLASNLYTMTEEAVQDKARKLAAG